MMQDIKEVIGLLMRALGGGEVTQAEVLDLDFEADGELKNPAMTLYSYKDGKKVPLN